MLRKKNLSLAADFLISSIDKKTGGSAAAYSRLRYPLSGWSKPYPETTGYIVPTLFKASDILGRPELNNKAIQMIEWLLSIQEEDGAFPGGVYHIGKSHNKSIFNTAQIIIGLVDAFEKTKNEKYRSSYIKAAQWLVQNQEENGTWVKHNYYKEYFPSYYTRVAWPILMVGVHSKDQQLIDSAVKTFDLILSKKLKNHMIKDSGFKPDGYAFLHTIAYTLRGFLEASFLLDNKEYYSAAYNLSKKLFRSFELKGQLAGAYYEDLKKIDGYRCLTGEAQMAIIWLKIFDRNSDARFLNVSSKIIDDICDTQPKHSGLFLKKGGLKGSHPYYGRYMIFRQPNWATKFFADAIILEGECLKKVNEVESYSYSRSF